jgi:hypothetical protein
MQFLVIYDKNLHKTKAQWRRGSVQVAQRFRGLSNGSDSIGLLRHTNAVVLGTNLVVSNGIHF